MDHAATDPAPGSASAYAGVGSRRTPAAVLAAMRDLAQALGDLGWALSTGGADGADTAFQDGALRTDAPITVHAPWPGYNGFRPGRESESDIDVVVPRPDERLAGVPYVDLARRHHPLWGRCGRGARALFLRNVSILAGARRGDGLVPPAFVLAWTANGLGTGRDAGGTGHTLRLADALGIPAVNLADATPPARNARALALLPDPAGDAVLRRFPGLPR